MAKLPQFSSVRDTQISRYSMRVRNLATRHDIITVVSGLHFDGLNPALKEKSDIGNWQEKEPEITVRLDRQHSPGAVGGGANLQIQVNDSAIDRSRIKLNKGVGKTIAQVIVPASIYTSAESFGEISGVRAQLETVVRNALLESAQALLQSSESASEGFGYKIVET